MPVSPLMEPSEGLLKGLSPVPSLGVRLLREDGTPTEAAPAPSLDKQCYNTLN